MSSQPARAANDGRQTEQPQPPFDLQPRTEAGRQATELAEAHAAELAPRVDKNDAAGTLSIESIEEMKASGLLRAPVPPELGGLGLDSLHDVAVVVNRIARADPSTAIAVNMHLTFTQALVRRYRGARETGDDDATLRTGALLRMIGEGAVVANPSTEPGADIRAPMTTATQSEGGWRIDGRKTFGTLCEAADLLMVTVRCEVDGQVERRRALVGRSSPGLSIDHTWDALGMRASGSHDVVLDGCFIPEGLVIPDGPWGTDSVTYLSVTTGGNIGLVAAFLGIAEAARDMALDLAKTRRKLPSTEPMSHNPAVQRLIAEMDVDLATSRSMLERSGRLLDAALVERPVAELTLQEMHRLNADFQCTKLVVQRKAIDVVDQALTVSGGAGYMSKHPLSRLYRDVRAGPFMQGHSPIEAYEYIGQHALGLVT